MEVLPLFYRSYTMIDILEIILGFMMLITAIWSYFIIFETVKEVKDESIEDEKNRLP